MWKAVKGKPERKQYRCGCGNRLLFVVAEPVARKVHIRSSSRRRIVAECPVCGHVKRIALGGPS